MLIAARVKVVIGMQGLFPTSALCLGQRDLQPFLQPSSSSSCSPDFLAATRVLTMMGSVSPAPFAPAVFSSKLPGIYLYYNYNC